MAFITAKKTDGKRVSFDADRVKCFEETEDGTVVVLLDEDDAFDLAESFDDIQLTMGAL